MFRHGFAVFQALVAQSLGHSELEPVSQEQAKEILNLEATFASGKWLDISHFLLDINDYEIGEKISQTPDGVRVKKGRQKATGEVCKQITHR